MDVGLPLKGQPGRTPNLFSFRPEHRARAKVPALNSPSPLLGKFPEWLYMNSPIEIDASGGDGGDRFARKFFEESAAQDDRADPSVFYARVETLARNGGKELMEVERNICILAIFLFYSAFVSDTYFWAVRLARASCYF